MSALRGGGQTYLHNLFESEIPSSELKIYLTLPRSAVPQFKYKDVELLTSRFASISPLQRSLWEISAIPKLVVRHKVDAMFYPGGIFSSATPRTCKTAIAFQNMLPFAEIERKRYPHGYMRMRLLLLKYLMTFAIRRSDLVIYISNYAKKIIEYIIPRKNRTSVVIPHGVNERFGRRVNFRPPELPKDYILYVSILDVYKAQLEIVHAWHLLRRRRKTTEKLVLAGPEYAPYGKRVRSLIRSLGLEKEILIIGNVPFIRLPAYYQNAKVNIFASSCENCPNILLEALAAGRPVFCSNFDPMPEFGGKAVAYFNPYQPSTLVDLFLKYLDDQPSLEEMSRKAALRAKRFELKNAAHRTWQALVKLAYS